MVSLTVLLVDSVKNTTMSYHNTCLLQRKVSCILVVVLTCWGAKGHLESTSFWSARCAGCHIWGRGSWLFPEHLIPGLLLDAPVSQPDHSVCLDARCHSTVSPITSQLTLIQSFFLDQGESIGTWQVSRSNFGKGQIPPGHFPFAGGFQMSFGSFHLSFLWLDRTTLQVVAFRKI